MVPTSIAMSTAKCFTTEHSERSTFQIARKYFKASSNLKPTLGTKKILIISFMVLQYLFPLQLQ